MKQSEADVAAAHPAPEPPPAPAEAATPATEEPPPAPVVTRYAAESAVAPPPAETTRPVTDWRPPRWSPTGDERDEADDSGNGTSPLLKWLAGIAVVAVLVIAADMLFRFGPWRPQPAVVPTPLNPAEERMMSTDADTAMAARQESAGEGGLAGRRHTLSSFSLWIILYHSRMLQIAPDHGPVQLPIASGERPYVHAAVV